MKVNQDVVRRAIGGDREAFVSLYGSVYKALYAFAYYTLQNAHDAEDVVSETVLAAFEQISRLKNEEAFGAWIFKILANRCKRRLKQYTEKTERLNDSIIFTDSEEWDNDVKSMMGVLSKEERMIVSLTVIAGYTSGEIGRILHRNSSTVRSKYSRALKKMQKELEKQGGGIL
jgi:RNA polymerase sigma factor (sigma-70 family)